MRARHDDGAAVVLRAVLKATRTAENKVKTEYSGKLEVWISIFCVGHTQLIT